MITIAFNILKCCIITLFNHLQMKTNTVLSTVTNTDKANCTDYLKMDRFLGFLCLCSATVENIQFVDKQFYKQLPVKRSKVRATAPRQYSGILHTQIHGRK